jgi:hypothetical protein
LTTSKAICDNCGQVEWPTGGIMYTSTDKAYMKCDVCDKYAIVLEIGDRNEGLAA